MRKKYKNILIGILSTIAVSNIPIFTPYFTFFLDEKHYRYSNYNGTHTSTEFGGRDYNMMKRLNQFCLDENPNQKDKKLYRLFWKNPLAFWRWRLYFYDERYKLPYKNWEEIESQRGKVKETQGCSISF